MQIRSGQAQQLEVRKVHSYHLVHQRSGFQAPLKDILGIQYRRYGKAYRERQPWQHVHAYAQRHGDAQSSMKCCKVICRILGWIQPSKRIKKSKGFSYSNLRFDWLGDPLSVLEVLILNGAVKAAAEVERSAMVEIVFI